MFGYSWGGGGLPTETHPLFLLDELRLVILVGRAQDALPVLWVLLHRLLLLFFFLLLLLLF